MATDPHLPSPEQCCQTTESTKEGTENCTAHLTAAVPKAQSKVILANLYETMHTQNQALQMSTGVPNRNAPISAVCRMKLWKGRKISKSIPG